MEYFLEKSNFFPKKDTRLVDIIGCETVRENGCILLSFCAKNSYSRHFNQGWGEADEESFVNHIHIEDHIKRNRLSAAYWFLKIFFQSWHKCNPDSLLVGLIMFSRHRGTVRFHRYREEVPSLVCDNLEEYSSVAVLEIKSLYVF